MVIGNIWNTVKGFVVEVLEANKEAVNMLPVVDVGILGALGIVIILMGIVAIATAYYFEG